MYIYLDTKDLINLFEKSNSSEIEDFKDLLIEGSHKLVLSTANVFEISSPLNKTKDSNVMSLFVMFN